MKVTPPAGIHGYSFIDDSEDEAEDEVAEGGSDEDVVDEEDLVSDEDE